MTDDTGFVIDPDSPLGSTFDRLREEKEVETLDIPVEGTNISVRYAKLVGQQRIKGYIEKRKEAQGSTWEYWIALDLMVDSCVGVFAEVDGVKYGLSADQSTDPDEWPRFDNRLRDFLPEGVEAKAVSICRALFAAAHNEAEEGAVDADITYHSDSLVTFYGWNKAKKPNG